MLFVLTIEKHFCMIYWGPSFQNNNLRNFWDLCAWPSGNHFCMIAWGPNFQQTKMRNFWDVRPWPSKNDFWRISRGAKFPRNKTWETFYILFFRIFGPEIIDFWSPQGSRTPGPLRNFSIWGRAICPCSQEVSSGVPAGGKEKEVCVGPSRKNIWIGPIGVFLSSGRCFPDVKKALKMKTKTREEKLSFPGT